MENRSKVRSIHRFITLQQFCFLLLHTNAKSSVNIDVKSQKSTHSPSSVNATFLMECLISQLWLCFHLRHSSYRMQTAEMPYFVRATTMTD